MKAKLNNTRKHISKSGIILFLKNLDIGISQNFGGKENCVCGNEETMSHIYSCEYLNIEETELEYEKIFNRNISEQISIFRRFENNLKARNKRRLETETNDLTCDQFNDPLNCVQYSFG